MNLLLTFTFFQEKKKKGDEPPPIGPFVTKLHMADNGIDIYEDGGDKAKSLQLIHKTLGVFARLIKYSKDLEELDLHNNTIGNMGAVIILHALEYRKYSMCCLKYFMLSKIGFVYIISTMWKRKNGQDGHTSE
jgi:hypothetical protein